MSTETLDQLFVRIQNRDAQAFNEMARSISDELYGFILRMVGNTDDASDILQDTYVRVWEKSHQFKGDSSPKTWIYRIAINLSYNQLKKRKRWSTTIIDEVKTLISGSDPVKETELLFQSDKLGTALTTLTPRQKAVVIGRIYKDLPFKDIAAGLGCSVNSAKVHFHEGKKRIEKYLHEKVGEHG